MRAGRQRQGCAGAAVVHARDRERPALAAAGGAPSSRQAARSKVPCTRRPTTCAVHRRQERLQSRVEASGSARLREQMHRWRPAAGHQSSIAGDIGSPFVSSTRLTRRAPRWRSTSCRYGSRCRTRRRRDARRRGALIDDRGDRRRRPHASRRRRVGGVVRGGDHHARAGLDAVAV